MQIEKYYFASEITVLGVCFVMLVLLFVSFKVRMKDGAAEKAFIDELRTKNGNLEIALLPYTETENQL